MIVSPDPRAIRFEDMAPTTTVPEDWIGIGKSVEATHILFASPDGKFVVQVWEGRIAEGDRSEVNIKSYPVDEFVTIISGEVTLGCEGQADRTYGPGDSFVLPKGHVGTWKQTGPVRKYSVCYLG